MNVRERYEKQTFASNIIEKEQHSDRSNSMFSILLPSLGSHPIPNHLLYVCHRDVVVFLGEVDWQSSRFLPSQTLQKNIIEKKMGGSLPKEVRERIGIIKRDDGADLNLRDCKLKVIPATELSKLKNLKRVNLEKNDINELPSKKIHKLISLEYLNLAFNNIEQLPVEIVFLHNLVELNISSNKIHVIPEGISSLHKLQKLHLSLNPIGNKLPGDLMKGCSDSLTELRLSGCDISELPNSILVLKNLKVLDLR